MSGVIFLLLLITLSILKVNAMSVVSDYLVNDTMELIEGTSKIYSIRLQNPSEQEVGIKLDYKQSIMKVIDYKEMYILSPKTTGYRIEFNVTAPKKPGLYKMGYTVSEVEPSGGGGLPIRLKINRNFNIKVIKDPNKFYLKREYVAYAVVVLVFSLCIIWKEYIKKHPAYKLKKRKVKNRKIVKGIL